MKTKALYIFVLVTVAMMHTAQAQMPMEPVPDKPVVVNDTVTTISIPAIEIDELDNKLVETLMSNDLYDYMHDEIISNNDTLPFERSIPTELLKERLFALNASTPFDVEYNEALERVVASYLKRNTTYMEKVMTLSDYYFPMIEAKLDKYDIPLEMKYLAIVESSLNPKAKSRAGATGMWQFMYGTGQNYGLEVSSYVDERMDPIKATEAACKYLRALYNIYGNWDLVLAAYNSGPGNVNKAIKRSGGSTNYWNIRSYLPRETANYVPAFQATMYIYQYAKDHGYKPGAADFKRAATDTILVKNMIALERIAEFLDEDLETLQFLNPSYKLDIIPVIPGKTHWIRLPREAANTFVMKEQEAYAFANPKRERQKEEIIGNVVVARSESKTAGTPLKRAEYTVRNGDYLGKIAARYDVGVSEIKAWNNLRSNSLKVGQTLYIHSKKSGSISNKETKVPKIYTVKGGDSYWKIARKYGLTIVVIKKMNPQVTELKPGMKLRLS